MKQKIYLLIVAIFVGAAITAIAAAVFPRHKHIELGGFLIEYPRELIPTQIPGPGTDTENGVSFGDTAGGPFIISARVVSTAQSRAEICRQIAQKENPDNDPGIQEMRFDRGNGRTLVITSRYFAPFRIFANTTSSGFAIKIDE